MSVILYLIDFFFFFISNRDGHFICILLTGEEIPAPEPGGQDERDRPYGGGKVQTLCLQSGGEESRPHPQVGGEVTRIH